MARSTFSMYQLIWRFLTLCLILISLTQCSNPNEQKPLVETFQTLPETAPIPDQLNLYEEAIRTAEESGQDNAKLFFTNKLARALINADSNRVLKKLLTSDTSWVSNVSNKKYKAEFYYHYSKLYHIEALFDTSLALSEQALNLIEEAEPSQLHSEIYLLMAYNWRFKNDFEKHAKYILQSLRAAEIAKDSSCIYDAKAELGVSHFYLENWEEAIPLFNECLGWYRLQKDSADAATTYSLLGLTYMKIARYDQAQFDLEQSLEWRVAIGNTKGIGESYNNLAVAQMYQSNWEAAISYLRLAYRNYERIVDDRHLPSIALNIGDCYAQMGKEDSAFHYFNASIRMAQEAGNALAVSGGYQRINKLQVQNENYQDALISLEQSHSIQDSIFKMEKVLAIAELEQQYAYDLQEREAIIEQSEKELTLFQILSFVGGGFVLFFILFIVFFAKSNRLKRERILKEKEEQQLKSEIESSQQKLTIKENELRNLANQITLKNSFIDELKEQLPKDETWSVQDLLNIKLVTTEDWYQFQAQFAVVHPNLTEFLRKEDLQLSLSDKRYIMLTKLGLNYNEISQVLGISPGSVRTHKYRLNKKLAAIGTSAEQILEEY